jgi:hypothetical protein
VNAIYGLILHGGIPPEIEEDGVIGNGQVEALPTRFEGDEHDAGLFGIVEVLQDLLPLLLGHATVQPDVTDTLSSEEAFDAVM